MRKLFRFKYEPCNGMCYAWCITLTKELRKLSEDDRQNLVDLMVRAHNQLCDNPEYSFGVDVDEENDIFVAHFRTPEKTDLYSDKLFGRCIQKVCDEVLLTDIPQVEGDCVFGDNGAESLGEEILRFCTDEGFKKLQKRHCECKAHVA